MAIATCRYYVVLARRVAAQGGGKDGVEGKQNIQLFSPKK